MRNTSKDSVFKPAASPRDKADTTTAAARAIIQAEVSARVQKTERLRKLRLAAPAVEEPVKKAPSRKTPARGKAAAGKR